MSTSVILEKGVDLKVIFQDLTPMNLSDVKMELGNNGDLTRKVSIFFSQKYSGTKFKEIGEYFEICNAVVSQTKRRLELEAEESQQFKVVMSTLKVALGVVRC